jgi:hypothetical protein
MVLIVLAGCGHQQDQWKSEYLAVVKKWDAAYSGADARAAYEETLAYTEYVKKMQRDGVPIEADASWVLVWNYARLGLLADHLGKKEESARYFATAVRYAKTSYPKEPDSKTSEAAFRSALDQMDTPDKIAWRRK